MRPALISALLLILCAPAASSQARNLPLAVVFADSAGLVADLARLPPNPDLTDSLYQVVYDGAGRLAKVEQVMHPEVGPDTAVVRILRQHLSVTAAPDGWVLLRVLPGGANPLAVVVPQLLWSQRGRALRAPGTSFPMPEPGMSRQLLVRIRVGPDGRPTTVFLLNSSGVMQADVMVVLQGRALHFRPAVFDGQPTPVWITLPMTVSTGMS
ncbi:MAG TPA: energy transducer TonB [Longimicrobiaceae bacterium]|nr:energy transducer TonB [Longimicrobiaceae bacterium]